MKAAIKAGSTDTDGAGDCNSVAQVKPAPVAAKKPLLANAEFADNVFVSFGVVGLQVVEQAATLADHHQETAAGGVILLMRLEVLRQLTDSLTKHRDLDLGATGVVIVRAEPGNDVLFTLSG